jgi:hypothetical protein
MAEAMANEMDALDRALNTQAPKPQVPEDLREDYADALANAYPRFCGYVARLIERIASLEAQLRHALSFRAVDWLAAHDDAVRQMVLEECLLLCDQYEGGAASDVADEIRARMDEETAEAKSVNVGQRVVNAVPPCKG